MTTKLSTAMRFFGLTPWPPLRPQGRALASGLWAERGKRLSQREGGSEAAPFPLEYHPLPLRQVWLRGVAFMQGEG
jgi:hypothetical protein